MDLRCDSGILHGKLEDVVVEFKCKSARCGHQPGTVVLHRFNVLTGELLATVKFTDPTRRSNHATRNGISIRSA